MVRQSIITLALLHEFVYKLRGNNTYINLDRTALEIAHDLNYDLTSYCTHNQLLLQVRTRSSGNGKSRPLKQTNKQGKSLLE